MSLPRFFIPPAAWNPARLALEGDEARHCSQVMRKGAGDEVMLFNGAGAWARASIVSAAKDRVELTAREAGSSPAPRVAITLLQSIPKGSNMDLIIEKAVELGVSKIVPVMTERTVVRLDARETEKKREKWQRLALEACKQCGQNWLPEVALPQPLASAWASLPAHDLRLVAAIQPDARGFKEALAGVTSARERHPCSVLLLIGPEGDLAAAEHAAAREHGCQPVTLGSIILRVETAAMYCLSVLRHELG